MPGSAGGVRKRPYREVSNASCAYPTTTQNAVCAVDKQAASLLGKRPSVFFSGRLQPIPTRSNSIFNIVLQKRIWRLNPEISHQPSIIPVQS